MTPGSATPGSFWRCPRCGAVGEGAARFCGVCGGTIPEADSAAQKIAWEIEMPLLMSRFILLDFGKVFVWTALLAGFVMVVLLGNRYRAAFLVSSEGVGYESRSSQGKWGSLAAVAAGLFAGRPGVAGADFIGMAQEQMGVPWEEIDRVNEHPSARVFSLRNGWRVVLRLHRMPENYTAVRSLMAAHLPAGTIVAGPDAGGGEAFRHVLLGGAALAARRVRVADGMLEVQSLFGVRRMPLESLRRVEPLVRKKEQVGLRLTPSSGAALELDWSQLFNVEPVRAARFAG